RAARWNRLAAEVPDDRAELRLGVERQRVVDRVDAAVGAEQAVAGFAIGVVGDEVEETETLKTLDVRGILAQREVVLGEVGIHEELERALAIRSVPLDRRGDQAPRERLRQGVGGNLAPKEPGR